MDPIVIPIEVCINIRPTADGRLIAAQVEPVDHADPTDELQPAVWVNRPDSTGYWWMARGISIDLITYHAARPDHLKLPGFEPVPIGDFPDAVFAGPIMPPDLPE